MEVPFGKGSGQTNSNKKFTLMDCSSTITKVSNKNLFCKFQHILSPNNYIISHIQKNFKIYYVESIMLVLWGKTKFITNNLTLIYLIIIFILLLVSIKAIWKCFSIKCEVTGIYSPGLSLETENSFSYVQHFTA